MSDDSRPDRELYEELYELICETVCMRHGTVRIGGEAYPHEMVRERFLKLNSFHLQYVIDCMQSTTVKIANVKAYLLTTLFNAPATMKHYYPAGSQSRHVWRWVAREGHHMTTCGQTDHK